MQIIPWDEINGERTEEDRMKAFLTNEAIRAGEGLTGYKEYMQKVKYRMIPFVW